MAEHTLAQVQRFQADYPGQVEVRFTGGSEASMRQWLGSEWTYTAQGEGDLGARMGRSLQAAFAAGIHQAIIIGTDCPDLDDHLLTQAFQALDNQDLVLGPARDGGYYLIGMTQWFPELFTDIAWSTAGVFARTLDIAQELGLAIALLPTLADVDYPEDLPIWERIQAR
jgi:hypothetical protein